jgi:hypothetical protein
MRAVNMCKHRFKRNVQDSQLITVNSFAAGVLNNGASKDEREYHVFRIVPVPTRQLAASPRLVLQPVQRSTS